MHPLDERKKNGYIRMSQDRTGWEWVLGEEVSAEKFNNIREAAASLENAREARDEA